MLDAMVTDAPDARFRPDSFIVGANLPWLTYGCDFGKNRWSPDGGVATPASRARLRTTLARLSDAGASHVRWFLLCDGRTGIQTDRDGNVLGPDDRMLPDLEAGLDELERSGLAVIFVLFDFLWFTPERQATGVQLGGRGAWLADPARRRRTLDALVAPVLEAVGRHPAIAAWDIVNEPEWVTRRMPWLWRMAMKSRSRLGVGTTLPDGPGFRGHRGAWVRTPSMQAIIGDACGLVHDVTSHAATVGLASTRGLRLVKNLGLDFHQVHWYDRLDRRAPLDRPVAALGLDRPLVLGEFPTRASRRSPENILQTARQAGYSGALAWSALAADRASDPALLESGLRRFRRL